MAKADKDAVKQSEQKATDADKERDWDAKGSQTNRDINQGNQHHDFDEGSRTDHVMIRGVEDKKNTGRETGLVSAPEVSLNPSSSNPTNKSWKDGDNTIIDNAILPNANMKESLKDHPFLNLENGQGMLVPLTEGVLIDDLVAQLNKEAHYLRGYGAEVEKDINGDEILEMVIIQERRHNEDGTVQLTGGKPVVGANQQNRPKLIHARNFIVRAVTKDTELGGDKTADSDGVMVIRVA